MPTQVITARNYQRRVSRLLSPDARAAAEASIVARPDAWPLIQGTGGARKARIGLPGRGKSGGARVIYFFSVAPSVVALLDIYAKNTKEDLTATDKRDIRAAIRKIQDALHEGSRHGPAGT
jgi:phage-related protein